jgi:hypothetical protein
VAAQREQVSSIGNIPDFEFFVGGSGDDPFTIAGDIATVNQVFVADQCNRQK